MPPRGLAVPKTGDPGDPAILAILVGDVVVADAVITFAAMIGSDRDPTAGPGAAGPGPAVLARVERPAVQSFAGRSPAEKVSKPGPRGPGPVDRCRDSVMVTVTVTVTVPISQLKYVSHRVNQPAQAW